MDSTLLNREARPDDLRLLVRENCISPAELEEALRISAVIPDGKSWSRFLDRLFLLLGALLVVAGIIFFFAYNWASMPRQYKLGLVEAALLAAAFTASYLGLEKPGGKAALLAASVLVGALLALFGQIYQTGADAYELFLGWSALIAGWAVISQFAPLWFLLHLLIETTVYLYWGQVVELDWFMFHRPLLFEILFLINAAGLVLWEFFSGRGFSWLTGRWIPRSILSMGFLALVIPLIVLIFEGRAFRTDPGLTVLLPLLYLGACGFVIWFYQARLYDLYMIAAVLLSLIVVLTAFFGNAIGGAYSGFLVLSVVIVGLSAAAAAWLRNIARSREAS